jgi:hypothetical protein
MAQNLTRTENYEDGDIAGPGGAWGGVAKKQARQNIVKDREVYHGDRGRLTSTASHAKHGLSDNLRHRDLGGK